jgi:hypothetical protein
MQVIYRWVRSAKFVALVEGNDGQLTVQCGRKKAASEVIESSLTADEVVFNAHGSLQLVQDHIGKKALQELLATLTQRRVLPKWCYQVPDSERKEMADFFGDGVNVRGLPDHDYLPAWTIIWREDSTGGGGRILMRYNNGAMAWVQVDVRKIATLGNIVVGFEAQDLDIEYGLQFSAAEKTRIATGLIPGIDGMSQLRKLYGRNLVGVRLLADTLMDDGGRQQSWHVHDFGVIVMSLAGDGTLKEYRLLEKGDAYVAMTKRTIGR